jgi:hypothetical protein
MRISRVLQKLAQYSNPVTRFLLARRTHVLVSRNLVLLRFVGRNTGRTFSTPVSYVRWGDDLLVPGGGAWWKNLSHGPVSVCLKGSWRGVTPEVITDQGAMSDVLGRMMEANPAISTFTGIGRDLDGRPSPQALEREQRRGLVVVRLHLDSQGGGFSSMSDVGTRQESAA